MSDESDPWSKDIPVGPAPTEFVFDEPERLADPELAAAEPAEPADAAPVVIDTTARRRWVGGGVVLSVIVVGALVASSLRSDDTTSDAPEVTSPVSVDEVSDSNARPTTVVPATSEAAPPTTQLPLAVAEEGPVGTWVEGQFALPERLLEIAERTQLVALSQQGIVIEIDIPSGATSTLDLDQRRPGSRLDVRKNASLVIGDGGSTTATPTIVRPGQPPIEVDMPAGADFYNLLDSRSNIEPFVIDVFNASGDVTGSGQTRTLSIDVDGATTDVEESWETLFFGQYEVVTGELLVFESGDLFLVSPAGQEPATARRISTGTLIGRSPGVVLVAECDAELVCGNVLIDVESGERTPVPEIEGVEFDRDIQLVSMSPDGAVLLVDGDSGDDSMLVEVGTGDATPIPIPGWTNATGWEHAWALDGSGVFVLADDGIVFIDRLTGDATPLPIAFEGFDRITDLGTRPIPES